MSGCGNGDPILLDVAVEKGSVWYAAHDLSDLPLRQTAIRVASDVEELVSGYGLGHVPSDYYQAKDKQRG